MVDTWICPTCSTKVPMDEKCPKCGEDNYPYKFDMEWIDPGVPDNLKITNAEGLLSFNCSKCGALVNGTEDAWTVDSTCIQCTACGRTWEIYNGDMVIRRRGRKDTPIDRWTVFTCNCGNTHTIPKDNIIKRTINCPCGLVWESTYGRAEIVDEPTKTPEYYRELPIQPCDVIMQFMHANLGDTEGHGRPIHPAQGYHICVAIQYLMRAGRKGPWEKDVEKAMSHLHYARYDKWPGEGEK